MYSLTHSINKQGVSLTGCRQRGFGELLAEELLPILVIHLGS